MGQVQAKGRAAPPRRPGSLDTVRIALGRPCWDGIKCPSTNKLSDKKGRNWHFFDKNYHFYWIYLCCCVNFTRMGDVQSRVWRLKFIQLLSQCDKTKICHAKGGLPKKSNDVPSGTFQATARWLFFVLAHPKIQTEIFPHAVGLHALSADENMARCFYNRDIARQVAT
jgi:hypothetical protein